MEQLELLQRIADDVSSVKQKIEKIEQEVVEISDDLHEVKPEYLEKLKRIDSGGFLTRAEFEKRLGD